MAVPHGVDKRYQLSFLLTRRAGEAAVLAGLLSWSASAGADDLQVHAGLGAAHAATGPQEHEFGWGGATSLALELPLGHFFGLQIEGSGLYLPRSNPPENPAFADHGNGDAFGAMFGVRARPLAATSLRGLWLDINGGLVRTEALTRPGFDAHIGYNVLANSSKWEVGPFVGYTQVFQPSDALRPDDAHIVSLGFEVGYGAAPVAPPPAVPQGEMARARTDRDGDSVFDDEDACPDTPGIRTNDPRTTGCPRSDRDNDLVFDEEDACPDVPGVRTTDPQTNGCPSKDIRVVDDHIVVDEIIHFGFDAARMDPASVPVVEKLAQFINNNPGIARVEIIGHADEVGPEAYNQRLSERRANHVRELLIQFGVEERRIVARGYGESKPRREGHTEMQYRENRRVEFLVTRSGGS